MTITTYDPSKPNHKAPCQRIAHAAGCRVVSGACGPECVPAPCRANGDHPAGRHLDQRDELYDGPGSLLGVLPMSVRDSARRIVREAPALTPEVIDMANEIQFLRNQVAAVSVDKDRSVREAMARSGSCEHHGREIEELGKALHAANQRAEKIERARLALLGFYQSVKDAVTAYEEGRVRTEPTLKAFMGTLGAFVKRAGAAHDRAWK